MHLKYVILMYFLTTVHSRPTSPKVYEEVIESAESGNNSRTTRNPKTFQRYQPPRFDYKNAMQQDPQKIRYSQQQQIDSYLKAYRIEQQSRRDSKSRKQLKETPSERPELNASATLNLEKVIDEPTKHIKQGQKSENAYSSSRQTVNFYPLEQDVDVTDQYSMKKAVDLKNAQRTNNDQFPGGNKSPFDTHQKVTGTQMEKVLSYRVNEDIPDQETQPSSHSRVYTDTEEYLKALQYPGVLSRNYLAKPTYVFANPQLAVDPKLLMQGLGYTLPNDHPLSYEGFQPATKSDIEALSSLLGKPPSAQLQGLNELLGKQPVYPAQNPINPVNQELLNQEQLISIQPQPLVALKDYTPIKEDVVDVANTQSKPNIRVETLQVPKVQPYGNHENLAKESKSVYGQQDDNLQYAAQYAFGYKIRDFYSGNNFGHEEIRDGDVVKGHYHVLLPDGRLQSVEYWADPSGYHAKVTYSSAAHH